jgi:predicted PolB exonuclease-like 3'-5' exonuclease
MIFGKEYHKFFKRKKRDKKPLSLLEAVFLFVDMPYNGGCKRNKHMQERHVFLDIETFPDLDAGRALLDGMTAETPDAEVREALAEYHRSIGSSLPAGQDVFFKPVFHRVAAIGALDIMRRSKEAAWTVRGISSSSLAKRSEAESLAKLDQLLRAEPRASIIGWNTRGFDLPVLRYRAMALQVPMPTLLFQYPEEVPKWKWNEDKVKPRDYWRRYGDDHLDLMESLSGFGASSRAKLREVAAALGVPAKIGELDGSGVETAIQKGRMAEVEEYAQRDCVTLYCIWLRRELASGTLSKEMYWASLASLRDAIIAKTDHTGGHLAPFLAHVESNVPGDFLAVPATQHATPYPKGEPNKPSPEAGTVPLQASEPEPCLVEAGPNNAPGGVAPKQGGSAEPNQDETISVVAGLTPEQIARIEKLPIRQIAEHLGAADEGAPGENAVDYTMRIGSMNREAALGWLRETFTYSYDDIAPKAYEAPTVPEVAEQAANPREVGRDEPAQDTGMRETSFAQRPDARQVTPRSPVAPSLLPPAPPPFIGRSR